MNDCCRAECAKSLRRHRDVATCDACGNDTDFERTVEELERHEVDFQTETLGKLRIVAKARSETH